VSTPMTPAIDIWVDFTTQDDSGLPWTLLSEAVDPALILPACSSWPATLTRKL
jgi:hypothetical protein